MLRYFDQTVVCVLKEDDDGILIAEGNVLWRYRLSNDSFTIIHETDLPEIRSFCLAGGFAVVFSANGYTIEIESVNLSDRSVGDSFSGSYFGSDGAFHSPLGGAVFAATEGLSPRDLEYFIFDETDGSFGARGDSQYHGDYYFRAPFALSPDGSYFLCADGNIFTAEDPVNRRIAHAGALPSGYSNAGAFYTGGSVVLLTEGGELVRLSASAPYAIEKDIRAFDHDPVLLARGTDVCYAVTAFWDVPWMAYVEEIADSEL